jgi:transcriptional regulator with XRE-family HTH domain
MNGRGLVAWNLRRIRVKRGLSQERLAFDSGVDRSYVGGLERREENPTVGACFRIIRRARERLIATQATAPGPTTIAVARFARGRRISRDTAKD